MKTRIYQGELSFRIYIPNNYYGWDAYCYIYNSTHTSESFHLLCTPHSTKVINETGKRIAFKDTNPILQRIIKTLKNGSIKFKSKDEKGV